MGPSNPAPQEFALPDLSSALSGLVTSSPQRKDGLTQKDQKLINKYKYDGSKYK